MADCKHLVIRLVACISRSSSSSVVVVAVVVVLILGFVVPIVVSSLLLSWQVVGWLAVACHVASSLVMLVLVGVSSE